MELLDIIEKSVDNTMTREEAEAYRLELMEERTVFVEESTSEFFGQEFNMWYGFQRPSWSNDFNKAVASTEEGTVDRRC